MTTQPDKAKRWRPRFSASTLLLITAVAAVSFGWWLHRQQLTDQVRVAREIARKQEGIAAVEAETAREAVAEAVSEVERVTRELDNARKVEWFESIPFLDVEKVLASTQKLSFVDFDMCFDGGSCLVQPCLSCHYYLATATCAASQLVLRSLWSSPQGSLVSFPSCCVFPANCDTKIYRLRFFIRTSRRTAVEAVL